MDLSLGYIVMLDRKHAKEDPAAMDMNKLMLKLMLNGKSII
jgi:hypothetical protein